MNISYVRYIIKFNEIAHAMLLLVEKSFTFALLITTDLTLALYI